MWWYTPDKWTFSSVPRWWCGEGSTLLGAGWWRTSVFFKLTLSSKSWIASAKQEVRCCRAFSVWATEAVFSAKRRSWNRYSSVFVWACSLLRLNRLLSRQQWMYTAPSRSSMTCLSIMLNRVSVRTTLFHTVDNGERFREAAVQPNLANHAEELWGAAKVLHYHPQSFSDHCVKRFGQVNKCYIQSFVLLPAFLLRMNMSVVPLLDSEPTLGFW